MNIVNMIKTNKGITLVALIVTMFVLTVLATVSINAVLGEEGIMRTSQQAKEVRENATIVDQKNLNRLLEEYDNSITEPPLVSTITTTNHQTIITKDEKGNKVVVPGGFKLASDSGTTVQQGIVVEDNNRKSICMGASK